MTFQPVLPWPILAVVAGALIFARLVTLRQVLMTARQWRGRAALRWTGVSLAVLLLIAAATRPALPDERGSGTTPAAGANLNVFLVVDRSADASIEDYRDGEPRIAAMRDDIATVIAQYPAARFALVGLTPQAALDWPLSSDVWSLQPIVAALGAQDAGPAADPTAAANILRYQLVQATEQYPGSRNVLLYLSSEIPGSRMPQSDFDLRRGSVHGGAVLAYGGGGGIDEAELRQIAEQAGVPFLHRESRQPLQIRLLDAPNRAEAAERSEIYWAPALLAAGLLLAEIFLSVREFRRARVARGDLAS
jgi:hypothetical protein